MYVKHPINPDSIARALSKAPHFGQTGGHGQDWFAPLGQFRFDEGSHMDRHANTLRLWSIAFCRAVGEVAQLSRGAGAGHGAGPGAPGPVQVVQYARLRRAGPDIPGLHSTPKSACVLLFLKSEAHDLTIDGPG